MFNLPVIAYQAAFWLAAVILLGLFANTWVAFTQQRDDVRANRPSAVMLICAALVSAAFALSYFLIPEVSGARPGLDMSFLTVLAATSWIVLIIILVGMRWWPLQQVGLIVYPIAALCFTAAALSNTHRFVPLTKIWPLEAHIWLSLIAYAFLTVSAVQALFVIKKQQSLKRHENSRFVRALPALQALETTLFRLSAISHLWLTLALTTGFLFLESIFAQQLAHKTVLSIAAWLTLSIFMIGHKTQGWRGKNAAQWVIAAFILVLIGFVGSKFIYDYLL